MRRRELLGLSGCLPLTGCLGPLPGLGAALDDERDSAGRSSRSGGQYVSVESATSYVDRVSVGVEGVLRNVSDRTLGYVEARAYFYDSGDARLGQGLDNATDLPAGGRWEFDASTVDVDPDRVDRWELVPGASVD